MKGVSWVEWAISLGLFLFAVIIHEVSHGLVAYRLGDPTAKLAGRLTLNPLAHIDPVGMILLPGLLVLIHAPFVFGWAKPVPVNFLNLRHPKRDMVWVGLAGPGSNLLMAAAGAYPLRAGLVGTNGWVGSLLVGFVVINLVLAVFNFIPIPPLDGSRILMGLLPRDAAYYLALLEPFGFLLVLLLVSVGLVRQIVWPVVVWLLVGLGVR